MYPVSPYDKVQPLIDKIEAVFPSAEVPPQTRRPPPGACLETSDCHEELLHCPWKELSRKDLRAGITCFRTFLPPDRAVAVLPAYLRWFLQRLSMNGYDIVDILQRAIFGGLYVDRIPALLPYLNPAQRECVIDTCRLGVEFFSMPSHFNTFADIEELNDLANAWSEAS